RCEWKFQHAPGRAEGRKHVEPPCTGHQRERKGLRTRQNLQADTVIILAVDTTSEWGGVAIRRDGEVVANISQHAPDGFAHVLFQVVEEALEVAEITLEQI